MKQFYKKKRILLFIGIVLGVIYGLISRFYFDSSIATISFLVLVPIGLGVIPLLFASEDQLNSYKKILFIPWLSVITLFGLMITFGFEDFLCTFILLLPFFLIITFIAFLIVFINQTIDLRKKRKNKLLGLVILPFLFLPIENSLNTPTKNYHVVSETIIKAQAPVIWDNIVAVDTITESEYNPGILNKMGIPRPLKAEVTSHAKGGIRTGYFEDGLKFTETITEYNENKSISFSIAVDSTSTSNKIFQKHVLEGNYFRFNNAVYKLAPLTNGYIKLSLTSEYNLTSTVNFYGKFWANIMIKDFQDRLLEVIATRCEKP